MKLNGIFVIINKVPPTIYKTFLRGFSALRTVTTVNSFKHCTDVLFFFYNLQLYFGIEVKNRKWKT